MAAKNTPEVPTPHQKIAWAGKTGFPGSTYCCVCSFSTRLKPTTACSQEGCPNHVCATCHSEGVFCCSQTEDKRRERGFPHPVIHVAPDVTATETDAPAATDDSSPDPLDHQETTPTNEDDAVKEELLGNPPEALVDIILQQRNEIFTLKRIVNAYQQHSARAQQQRAALSEAIQIIDSLSQVQQQAPPAPSTQACSALPSKIDSDWQEVCASHPGWAGWWQSGKARPLRKVTHDTSPPPNNPDRTQHQPTRPPPATTTTTATATDPAHPPPSNGPRRQAAALPATRAAATTTTTTTTRPEPRAHRIERGEYANIEYSTSNGRQRSRTQGTPPFCGRCRQRGHTAGRCTAVVCDYCGHRGHLVNQCRTRQADESRRLECSYCLRRGHDENHCYTRASEARQERLLRSILAERQQPPPQPAPYRADLTATTHPAWPQPQPHHPAAQLLVR